MIIKVDTGMVQTEGVVTKVGRVTTVTVIMDGATQTRGATGEKIEAVVSDPDEVSAGMPDGVSAEETASINPASEIAADVRTERANMVAPIATMAVATEMADQMAGAMEATGTDEGGAADARTSSVACSYPVADPGPFARPRRHHTLLDAPHRGSV
ncbi:hypothetical protein [Microvirga puerhi]|uniref:DUF2382 domain-containing protein n=1 Tax=Microvirga puerhi TaxID=2876078 RepID=A0ABS7VIF9_9HYPH|nr:hypothetical protein [Microvirga puerhi]MBZ6075311.1 hypothetical protein [Microvirga puerhi]